MRRSICVNAKIAAAAMAMLTAIPKPLSLPPPLFDFRKTVGRRVFIQSGNDIEYRAI